MVRNTFGFGFLFIRCIKMVGALRTGGDEGFSSQTWPGTSHSETLWAAEFSAFFLSRLFFLLLCLPFRQRDLFCDYWSNFKIWPEF